jgi:hypothetical protein
VDVDGWYPKAVALAEIDAARGRWRAGRQTA